MTFLLGSDFAPLSRIRDRICAAVPGPLSWSPDPCVHSVTGTVLSCRLPLGGQPRSRAVSAPSSVLPSGAEPANWASASGSAVGSARRERQGSAWTLSGLQATLGRAELATVPSLPVPARGIPLCVALHLVHQSPTVFLTWNWSDFVGFTPISLPWCNVTPCFQGQGPAACGWRTGVDGARVAPGFPAQIVTLPASAFVSSLPVCACSPCTGRDLSASPAALSSAPGRRGGSSSGCLHGVLR